MTDDAQELMRYTENSRILGNRLIRFRHLLGDKKQALHKLLRNSNEMGFMLKKPPITKCPLVAAYAKAKGAVIRKS